MIVNFFTSLLFLLLSYSEANRKMEDDGIVLNIFDSIQDELKVKTEVLEERRQQVIATSATFLFHLLSAFVFAEKSVGI